MNEIKYITRIAPTPSGYLHKGNALNFLIISKISSLLDAKIVLRIDDHDYKRTRPEYVEDIFRSLDWLKITWDYGPSGPDDFYRNYSQRNKQDQYFKFLNTLKKNCSDFIFPCGCSRKDVRSQNKAGLHQGKCQNPDRPFAYRCLVPINDPVTFVNRDLPAFDILKKENTTHRDLPKAAPEKFDLYRTLGDPVLWRKDDIPAYQLVSLYEDISAGVNLIIRGDDLKTSTAFQVYLSGLGKIKSFKKSLFYHHKILYHATGKKMSKSEGALSLKKMRENNERIF